ncbi:hypothetical protein [Alteromonas facilis]|uniref:hypothetical protein n=1 Tax=Alteromonas facilis TaxID=2048004 RepID=UPI000C290E00|nr:hypothetical protein [Alteromonas facilis]
MLERRWQDKYGSYHIVAHDDYIDVTIIGAIGDNITSRYKKDVLELARGFAGQPFGIYADLSRYEGYTDASEQHFVEAYKSCLALGCVIDAATICTPLVKSQMQRINDLADIDMPLSVRLFKQREEGVAFVQKMVQKAKDRK